MADLRRQFYVLKTGLSAGYSTEDLKVIYLKQQLGLI